MSLIPFPNVPNLPGVPQLARASNGVLNAALPVLGAAAALGSLWRSLLTTPQWGIFKQVPEPAPDASGLPTVTVVSRLTPVVVPDSFQDLSYKNEYDVSDVFVQDGSFATYNKVANPFEVSVRMIKGGSASDRAAFLASIEAILATTDLYYILTPERTYANINPTRLEVTRRGSSAAFFLTEVDLFFREIRSETPQYTTTAVSLLNAQNPSAQDPQNNGVVNPVAPVTPPQFPLIPPGE